MSEQKWTPEDQWELLDWGHSCTLRIGEAYAGVPYEHPYGRGRCEKQMANGRRLVQCVKACNGLPDPAAEIARLRAIEAQYAVLHNAAKRVLEDPCDDNDETLDAHAELERAVYPTDERAKAAVDELGRLRKAEAIAEELAGDLSKMYDELIRIRRIRLATNPGALESEKARADAAEAELTKLRAVYPLAVKECRAFRKWCPTEHRTCVYAEAAVHDAARAEAGMENL